MCPCLCNKTHYWHSLPAPYSNTVLTPTLLTILQGHISGMTGTQLSSHSSLFSSAIKGHHTGLYTLTLKSFMPLPAHFPAVISLYGCYSFPSEHSAHHLPPMYETWVSIPYLEKHFFFWSQCLLCVVCFKPCQSNLSKAEFRFNSYSCRLEWHSPIPYTPHEPTSASLRSWFPLFSCQSARLCFLAIWRFTVMGSPPPCALPRAL